MRDNVKLELGWLVDNDMIYEMKQYYESARRYLTIPELLEYYALDDIILMEYEISHMGFIQRDIEALWENRLEEMVKEP